MPRPNLSGYGPEYLPDYLDGRGLVDRFRIERLDGEHIDPTRRYGLVLDLSGQDPHALKAAKAYAESVKADNPALSSDIFAARANPFAAPKQHRYDQDK